MGNQFNANTLNEKQDAAIPYTARDSMDAAAAEEPTKNRVFDVTLLLERIVADFEVFKNSDLDTITSEKFL